MYGTGLISLVLYLQCLLRAKATSCSSIFTDRSCSAVTTSGRLVGNCSNDSVLKFLGVPYAEPPTGSLRFSDPQPYQHVALKTVQTLPSYCPQLGLAGSEDCLYLNVWASVTSGVKPVLVWVHGGSNVAGGTADPIFDGTNFAKNENVVIVSFNYRLGLLGFYDDGSSTNFAVKDSILALKWVKNNIAKFGGDPSRITIFGNSSGGSLIRAILASSKATGLINNAIFQSDPQNFGFNERAVSNGYTGALARQLLNCNDVKCLRQKTVAELLSAEASIITSAATTTNFAVNKAYPFGPNIDNNILYKDYSAALADGSLANKVDTITGFVDQEAGPTISSLLPNSVASDYYIPLMESVLGDDATDAIVNSDPAFYDIIDSNITDCTRLQLVYTVTAMYWHCPIQYNAQLNSKSNKSWVYRMSKGIQHPTNAGYSLCQNGEVCHQDDLYATFGTYPSSTSSSLRAMSAQMQARWAAFARNGNPNISGGVQWNTAQSSTNMNILDFGSNTVNSTFEGDVCNNLHAAVKYSFEQYSV